MSKGRDLEKRVVMPEPSPVNNLEEIISGLPLSEQLLLIERVRNRIRKGISDEAELDSHLRKMAADPEVQKELREIEFEFSARNWTP